MIDDETPVFGEQYNSTHIRVIAKIAKVKTVKMDRNSSQDKRKPTIEP